MNLQYVGLKDINGPLVALEGVSGVAYDEIARIKLSDGTERIGRVVELEGDKAILQVFEGTASRWRIQGRYSPASRLRSRSRRRS